MRGRRYRKRAHYPDILITLTSILLLLSILDQTHGESGGVSRTLSSVANELLQAFVGLKHSFGDKDDKTAGDKTFFGQDVDGDSIIVGNWFSFASYTLAVAIFGTGFLVACWATAVYYVLFVVTDPTQSGLTKRR